MHKRVGLSSRYFQKLVQKKLQSNEGVTENLITDSDVEIGEPSSLNLNLNQELIEIIGSSSPKEENNKAKSKNCKETILKQLKNWCIVFGIRRAACDALLQILRHAGLNVPTTRKTLLGIKHKKITLSNLPPGQYFHYGIENSIKQLNYKWSDNIQIDINVDGLPLYKSSTQTLWPILGAFAGEKNLKPFLIGAYIGPRKPESINSYLKDFVAEIAFLKKNKIELNRKLIQISIRLFVCDVPARAFVTGTVGHTSANGCPKCCQHATKINNRLTYATTCGNLRTDESYKNRNDSSYHLEYFRERENLNVSQLLKCINSFFTEDLLMKINWSGNNSLFPLKSVNFFSTDLFEAVKCENFGYKEFEECMRKGLHNAKNRVYVNKYKKKNITNNKDN